MSNAKIGQKIIHLESVDSTNNYTANVFKEESIEPGTVILADIQTNGRGQRGNTWQSGAFENLTFSIAGDIKLWKINTLVDLNRLIALSINKFFKMLKLQSKIKWPNDIMIEDKKVCGILIENFFRNSEPKSVIGIGINVNQKEFNFERATSLHNLTNNTFERKELLFIFIEAMNEVFKEAQTRDSYMIHKHYDDLLWKKNVSQEFTLSSGQKKTGIIKGTTLEGNLIVFFDNLTKTYHNGEIKY